MNLGAAVGDDAAAVARNRASFAAAIGAQPVWLRQVHGTQVLRLQTGALENAARDTPADAAWTTESGIACAVLVADCLPVLLALRSGGAVAAAHAGWRGLAAGVLEATLHALCEGTGSAPGDVLAWRGPCIGPAHFEVGADVLEAFGSTPQAPHAAHFASRPRADGTPRWRADLAQLAHERLAAAGVQHIARSGRCTYGEPSDFFSFRRDRVTGRMAAAVWCR